MMTHTTIMRAVHNNRSTLRLCIFIALSITLTVKPQPLGCLLYTSDAADDGEV